MRGKRRENVRGKVREERGERRWIRSGLCATIRRATVWRIEAMSVSSTLSSEYIVLFIAFLIVVLSTQINQ